MGLRRGDGLRFDSIGQSPVDVRTLKIRSYDGRAFDVTLTKTGMEGAPIPKFPEAKAALDAYLATQPAKLPEAPLFTHDRIGGEWKASMLAKVHGQIRKAAGLPKNLQLQDFRTMVQTEGGPADGTVDELRGLARHSTRRAALHNVHPTSGMWTPFRKSGLPTGTKRVKKSESTA